MNEAERRAVETVENAQRAMERGDIPGFLAHFAEDGVVNDPLAPAVVGRAGLEQWLQGLLAVCSKVEMLELKPFASGRNVAVKVTLRLVGRNGRTATAEAIDVFELDESFRIRKMTAYWDPAPAMQALMG